MSGVARGRQCDPHQADRTWTHYSFALMALILFILAAAGLSTSINLIAWGLAFVALRLLFGLWPLYGNAP